MARYRAKSILKYRLLCSAAFLILAAPTEARADAHAGQADVAASDWAYYRGNPAGTAYSALDEISRDNASKLTLAWSFDTAETFGSGWDTEASDMECNPMAIGGSVYVVSPKGRLLKLNGATGELIWSFDPANGKSIASLHRLRGIARWTDGREERLFLTFERGLFAIDASTGRAIAGFGERGRVDLAQGLDRDPRSLSVSVVSPGVVYRDLIILGSTGSLPGHIRAFDVHTGMMRWIFHTIPYPGEEGYETWPKEAYRTLMGANNWAGMTLDAAEGVVYIPLASGGMAQRDFYGGDRLGDNLFANSLVALDASTGKKIWAYQMVRHDLWDRDLPAPPTLISIKQQGVDTEALAQITKSGEVLFLDRHTGAPLFPVHDEVALSSDVPGEVTAPTQPRTLQPRPFARQWLTEDTLTQRTPEAHTAVLRVFRQLRSRGPFDPPSLQGTVILPGLDGGGEWGGAAFDPTTRLLYINANEMPWILRLKARTEMEDKIGPGRAVYLAFCAGCHGAQLLGQPPVVPSLIAVGKRFNELQIKHFIELGNGRMPAFGTLSEQARSAVAHYIATGIDTPPDATLDQAVAQSARAGAPYVFEGYQKFLDPEGYPAISPPWGTLSALNVDTGQYVWRVPLGEYPELAAQGYKDTGSENYGGSVVTAGGVLFIGATVYDRKFRVFDKATGHLLWEYELPEAGHATPATYLARGHQYVVIPAGGGKDPKRASGSRILAFSLPR